MSHVYFFRPAGQDGPVKIGHSTYPASRLITYLAWSPVPLEVCAQIAVTADSLAGARKAARALERRFHARYADHRLHHEWFAAHPRLLRDIDLITRRRFRISTLGDETSPSTRRRSPAYALAQAAPTQRAAA